MSTKQKLSIDQMLNLEGQKSVDRMLTGLLFFMLIFVPLLTRVAVIDFASPVISGTALDSGMKADVFTYYKFIWLQIVTGLLLLGFLYKMIAKGYVIPASYINIPLLLMFVFTSLSGMLAENKMIAMFGQYNRHEGTLTYLIYFTLFFIAANILYTEKRVQMLVYATYSLLLVNVCLGIAYFYGANLLDNAFVRGLLLPSGIDQQSINGFFNSTINNPNYVSGIGGTLTVLFLAKAMFSHSVKEKVFDLLGACFGFTLVLTSLSTSGFFTTVVMIPVLILLLAFGRRKKEGIIVLAVAALLFSSIFSILAKHNPRVWNESLGFFLGSSEKKISMELYKEGTEEGNRVNLEQSLFGVQVASAAADANTEDEFNLPPQQWSAGTGRTYIWSKTLELVKQHPILGLGMDTLAYHFPQDDPYKNSGLNDANTIVDKPHNMYIGMAYGSGGIVLLAFLFMGLQHIWRNLVLIKNKIDTERTGLLAALFAGWCAYLVQALFNDSIIGTGFIFWTLFGVGVALMRQEEREKESV
ncbi:O-antigen ligase family protein [Aneurinibacillus uraniidurans]|uniref:O-antigen ligase family protein n=1 Tax=Aneurinibacillus uraniidurans TaxID=2966586 RepID=UPI00234B6C53|nr:O-antigen ligase family protein [Aneurinibacillus sp. B1]WCN38104.1 O-antigen ligase family protein [Aneurinibacillus sp. B1]